MQAAKELEAASNSWYQSTTDVYNFLLKCLGSSITSQECAAEVLQAYPAYNSAMVLFSADSSNVADSGAARLANQFGSEAGGMIAVRSAADARKLWLSLVTTYTELLSRCGELVQGQ